MTVQCFGCDRFRFKDKAMPPLGFGNCSFKSDHQFVSAVYPRDCDKFHPAPAAIAAEREKYLNKQKEKSK